MAAAGGLGRRTPSNDEIAMSLPALRRTDAEPIHPVLQDRHRALSQTALRIIGVTALAWGVRLADAQTSRAPAAGPKPGALNALQRLRSAAGTGKRRRVRLVPAALLAHSW